jgi:hypothetical protein
VLFEGVDKILLGLDGVSETQRSEDTV